MRTSPHIIPPNDGLLYEIHHMLRLFQIDEIHADLTWNFEHDETIHNNLLRRICIFFEKWVSPSQWLNLGTFWGFNIHSYRLYMCIYIYVYVYIYRYTCNVHILHQKQNHRKHTNTNSYISSSFNLEIPPKMADLSDLALGGSATGSGSSTSAAVPWWSDPWGDHIMHISYTLRWCQTCKLPQKVHVYLQGRY